MHPAKPSFFQRNWYYFTPAVIVAVPLLMGVYSMVNWGYGFAESMNALMHFGSSDTRYAVKFTEDKFHRIRPGIDGRQVFNLVGVPYEGQGTNRWEYSLPQDGAKYYHERAVLFTKDATGKPIVKKVVSRFHTPEMKRESAD